MDTDERWSAEWVRQQAAKFLREVLDKSLENQLLDNPDKRIEEVLRDAGLVKSARAIEVRSATPPDGPSRPRKAAPAPRSKRS